jgi:hypothetical protein
MNVEKNQNNQQFEVEGVVNLLFSCIICLLKKTTSRNLETIYICDQRESWLFVRSFIVY